MSLDTDITSLPKLKHIGVVVEDVDKTVKFLSAMWGLGPWTVIGESGPPEGTLMAGVPFKLKLAFTDFGPTQIELLQPLDPRALWYEFLKANGEGLHHLCFTVPNWDEWVAKAKEQGGQLLTGAIFEGQRWCYFGSKPGGIIFEYMEE